MITNLELCTPELSAPIQERIRNLIFSTFFSFFFVSIKFSLSSYLMLYRLLNEKNYFPFLRHFFFRSLSLSNLSEEKHIIIEFFKCKRKILIFLFRHHFHYHIASLFLSPYISIFVTIFFSLTVKSFFFFYILCSIL
jgi:hypothetical protein